MLSNSAVTGGAVHIHVHGVSTVEATSCTMAPNSAQLGGAVYTDDADCTHRLCDTEMPVFQLAVAHCDIHSNHADNEVLIAPAPLVC
jgi:hypothetical protein